MNTIFEKENENRNENGCGIGIEYEVRSRNESGIGYTRDDFSETRLLRLKSFLISCILFTEGAALMYLYLQPVHGSVVCSAVPRSAHGVPHKAIVIPFKKHAEPYAGNPFTP